MQYENKCKCGCNRVLKEKIIKLGYTLAFCCYYDSVRGKGKYKERRINRAEKRYKLKHKN